MIKNKFIKLILYFIFFQNIYINPGLAKSLPPGSGEGDVPSNVLILLDKSGSMSWSMDLGAELDMPSFISLGEDSDKNVITAPDSASSGIRNVSYSNALKAIGSSTKFVTNGDCDQVSKQVFVEQYNGHIYYFNASGQGCKVNINTGVATRFYNDPLEIFYGAELKDKYLYVFSISSTGIISIKIFNLDNNQLLASCDYGLIFSSNEMNELFTESFIADGVVATAIDKSGSSLVGLRSIDSQSSKMLKFPFDSGLGSCPSNTASTTRSIGSAANQINLTEIKNMQRHPTKDDTYIFSRLSKVYEYDFGSGTFGTGGQVGIGDFASDFTNYNPTQISNIKFNRAHGIAADEDNERIYVSDRESHRIQVFDKDWNFIKILGRTGGTASRMSAATDAIQEVVSDSDLTSGAHFGFGYWASSVEVWYTWTNGWHNWPTCRSQMDRINSEINFSPSSWLYQTQWNGGYWCDVREKPLGYTGWNNSADQGIPCPDKNCLKVKVDREGASKTGDQVKDVSTGGGTRAQDFTTIATQYFNHSTDSPIDTSASCQGNYVIIIGDGDWVRHEQAMIATTALATGNNNIKTYAIAFGPGISDEGMLNFDELAVAGGTERVRIASDGNMLKEVLNDIISGLIVDRVSFTSPSITAKVSEGGTLLQAQFQYVKRQEWNGSIKKTKLNEFGLPIPDHPSNWEAEEKMPSPSSRKIWTQLELSRDYTEGYNNVVVSNSSALRSMFERFGGRILDYHRDTAGVGGGDTTRCSNLVPSIEDGSDDDLIGLINFIRGEDYFDYDGDCVLNVPRDKYLGDVYNSDMLVIGKPSAEDKFTSNREEAYWRNINDYGTFVTGNAGRRETIYVGANDGMLHAFDFEDGYEVWGFIPPFLLPQIAGVINPSFNQSTPTPVGGTNSVYGVDGSPVQHDIFMRGISVDGTRENAPSWKTILMVPYGRGGAGFSILDVTDRDNPIHYFSVYNDKQTKRVYRMDHTGSVSESSYMPTSFGLAEFPEAREAASRHQANQGIDTTCNASGATSCHKAWTWTLPEAFNGTGVAKADLEVVINGTPTDLFFISQDANGNPAILFSSEEIFFQVASGPSIISGQNVGITIKPTSSLRSAVGDPDYDYSKLGETWSTPRIFRMPNEGRGDNIIDDDIYVAVMGAGFGNEFSGVASGVYVINLQDVDKPFKIQQFIEIPDKVWMNPQAQTTPQTIANSVPGDPVIITADSAKSYTNYRGALVYVNDYEGKITKINLTNLEGDGTIELYDSYTLFDSEATVANGAFMFHAMDASIGRKTKKLWLYAGTGDMNNLVDKDASISNKLLGIADKDFPNYTNPDPTIIPPNTDKLVNCHDTTGNTDPLICPSLTGLHVGWQILLTSAKKVTAEPTVAGGVVYFPVYKPPVDPCDLGPATICAIDDECGTNLSSGLGTHANDDECHYVGLGILSKIVAFGGKLYANIAGETADGSDLITKSAIGVDIEVGRNSWRQQQ